MPAEHTLLLFAAAALALIVVPGPAVLYIVTALFFLAFLPQFVDRGAGSVGTQIGVLGLLFVVLAVSSDSLWALAAGTASGWLRGNPRFLALQRYVSGSVFVGLGVLAVGTKRAHS